MEPRQKLSVDQWRTGRIYSSKPQDYRVDESLGQTEDSVSIVRDLENKIKRGVFTSYLSTTSFYNGY